MAYTYYVYCHTNKINGMKYIGYTHLDFVHRWGKDGRRYSKHTIFWNDIKKYGWDNFIHEILAYSIRSKKKADEIERQYIKEMNTLYPNGYNIEDGGIHGSTNPQSDRSIYSEKQTRPLKGWHHSEETRIKMSESYDRTKHAKNPAHSKPVMQYTKDGEFVAEYYGASEASRQTGCSVSTICKMCKDTTGRYKSVGGYVWKYKSL